MKSTVLNHLVDLEHLQLTLFTKHLTGAEPHFLTHSLDKLIADIKEHNIDPKSRITAQRLEIADGLDQKRKEYKGRPQRGVHSPKKSAPARRAHSGPGAGPSGH